MILLGQRSLIGMKIKNFSWRYVQNKIFAFRPITYEPPLVLTNFINVFQEYLTTIKTLEISDLSSFILFHISTRELDAKTQLLFEKQLSQSIMSSLNYLLEFILKRLNILKNIKGIDHQDVRLNNVSNLLLGNILLLLQVTLDSTSKKVLLLSSSSTSIKNKLRDVYKRNHHPLYFFCKFKKKSLQQQCEYVMSNKLCFCCMSNTYMIGACQSKFLCKKCTHGSRIKIVVFNYNKWNWKW